MKTLILFAALVLLPAAAGVAQSAPAQSPERAAAEKAYQDKDWKKAAELYELVAEAEPKDSGVRYRLGVALLNQSRPADAALHLRLALETSPNGVFAIALARAYAATGEKEKMYEIFERTLKLGGASASVLDREKEFDPVRAEPRFAEYAKKLDGVANPCRSRPEYREFDFWIGEWAPQNPQGITVGSSSIQLILNDCVIFENWNTPQGGGKSFSLWDARDGKWHQTWVDTRGGITRYTGGIENGNMVLVAETVNNGKPALMRMTYSKLADGAVRQHGESSADAGKTWTTVYDFKYVKAK